MSFSLVLCDITVSTLPVSFKNGTFDGFCLPNIPMAVFKIIAFDL